MMAVVAMMVSATDAYACSRTSPVSNVEMIVVSKAMSQASAVRSPVSWGLERNRDLHETAGVADATAWSATSRRCSAPGALVNRGLGFIDSKTANSLFRAETSRGSVESKLDLNIDCNCNGQAGKPSWPEAPVTQRSEASHLECGVAAADSDAMNESLLVHDGQ
jgi:hypothetical protein